jgi:hypothetical protein
MVIYTSHPTDTLYLSKRIRCYKFIEGISVMFFVAIL